MRSLLDIFWWSGLEFLPFLLLSLCLYLSVSLCRELNDINRKHIQESVASIRRVSTHSSTDTLLSPTVEMSIYLFYRTFLLLSSTFLPYLLPFIIHIAILPSLILIFFIPLVSHGTPQFFLLYTTPLLSSYLSSLTF